MASNPPTPPAKPWGGVFDQATDRRVEQFTESISFDHRLYAHDIHGSIAHAQMLAKVGLITADECRQIEQGLAAIRPEIEAGKFPFRTELEDIHMHIEQALIDRTGRRRPQAAHRPQPQRPGLDRPAALDARRDRPGRPPAASICSRPSSAAAIATAT